MKKKRILLIDDEAIFRKVMGNALKKDFEITTAMNGEEGLRLIREIEPKLVLLDILMPDIDGLEVLKRMRGDKKAKNIPVVLLTNVDKDESVSDGIALGARGYMIKGDYTAEEIVERVKSFI